MIFFGKIASSQQDLLPATIMLQEKKAKVRYIFKVPRKDN